MTGVLLIIAGFVIVLAWALWPLLPAHPGRHAAPRPVNGRNLGDQPRADQRPGKQPWLTAGQPVLPAPPLPHAYDPGDGILPPVPLARPYVPACTDAETLAMYRGDYGVKPQLEAERLAEVMMP